MSWRRGLFVLGLALGLLLFARQILVSYSAIQLHDFSLTRPLYLLAALGATVLMYFLQMLAWLMVMRYVGVPLRLGETVQGFYLSFLPRYIPGTVWGYWSRSQWLVQSYAVDYAVSIMGSILEALALVLTGLFMAGTYLLMHENGSARLILALACASLFGLAWLAPRLAMQIGRRFYKDRLALPDGQDRSLGAWTAAILLYLALWMVFGSAVLLTGSILSTIPAGDLHASVFAASLSWVIGFVVVFVPTGIGIRELVLSTLLSAYTHLPPWQADLVAVISRFEIIVAELVWLVVGLGIYAYRWGSNRDLRGRLRQSGRK